MTLQDRLQDSLTKTLAQLRGDRTGEMDKAELKEKAVEISNDVAVDADAELLREPEILAEPEALATPGSDQFKAEQDALVLERDQLLDRLARLQAEFENARKRDQRERADFRDYATGNVVEKFLPVVDNFNLALKAGGSAEQMRLGVELIVKQMEDVLRQLDVQPVETIGVYFDPRVHEALGTEEREDVPDQQVIDEIRRGYRIRERLLRPAMVRVASNKKQTEA